MRHLSAKVAVGELVLHGRCLLLAIRAIAYFWLYAFCASMRDLSCC